MKSVTARMLSLIVACVLAGRSGAAFAEPSLYDLLNDPAYAKSWSALFAGEENVDPWLAAYARTKDGPASPGTTIAMGGTPGYQVNTVCKTHDCGNNEFFALFAPKGTKAWGLLVKDGKTERFFGNPREEQKKALRAATRQ